MQDMSFPQFPPNVNLPLYAEGQSAVAGVLFRSVCPRVTCPKAMIWCLSFIGILMAWTALTVAIVHHAVETSIGQCRTGPEKPFYELAQGTVPGGSSQPNTATPQTTSGPTAETIPLDIKLLARMTALELKQVSNLNLWSGAWNASLKPLAVTRRIWGLNPAAGVTQLTGFEEAQITLDGSSEVFHPRLTFLGHAKMEVSSKGEALQAIDGRKETCAEPKDWWQVNLGQNFRLSKLRLLRLELNIKLEIQCEFNENGKIETSFCGEVDPQWEEPRGHVVKCECSATSLKIKLSKGSRHFRLCEVEVYVEETQPLPEPIKLPQQLERSACDFTSRSCTVFDSEELPLKQSVLLEKNEQLRVALNKSSLKMVRLLFDGRAPEMTFYAEASHVMDSFGIPCARTSPFQLTNRDANNDWIEVLCNPTGLVNALMIQLWGPASLRQLTLYADLEERQICNAQKVNGNAQIWCDPYPLLLDGTREHLRDFKTQIRVGAKQNEINEVEICAKLKSGLGWMRSLRFQCRKVLRETEESNGFQQFKLKPSNEMESCGEFSLPNGFVYCQPNAASKQIRPLADDSRDLDYDDVRVNVEGLGNYKICANVLGPGEPGRISIVCHADTTQQQNKILQSVTLVTDLGRLVISPQAIPEFHEFDTGNFEICGDFLQESVGDSNNDTFLTEYFQPSIISLHNAMCKSPEPFKLYLSNLCPGTASVSEAVQVQLDITDGFNSHSQIVSSSNFSVSLKAIGFIPKVVSLSVLSGNFRLCHLSTKARIMSAMEQNVTWEAAMRSPFQDPLPVRLRAGQSLSTPMLAGVAVTLNAPNHRNGEDEAEEASTPLTLPTSDSCVFQGHIEHLARMFPDDALMAAEICVQSACGFTVGTRLKGQNEGVTYSSTKSFPVPSLPHVIRCGLEAPDTQGSFYGWLRLQRPVLKGRSSGASCVPELKLDHQTFTCSGIFNGRPYWAGSKDYIAWQRMENRRPSWVKMSLETGILFGMQMPAFAMPSEETHDGAVLVEYGGPGNFLSTLHAHLFMVKIVFYDNSVPTYMKLSDVKVYAQLKVGRVLLGFKF